MVTDLRKNAASVKEIFVLKDLTTRLRWVWSYSSALERLPWPLSSKI